MSVEYGSSWLQIVQRPRTCCRVAFLAVGAHLRGSESGKFSHKLSPVAQANITHADFVLILEVCVQGFQRGVLAVVTGHSCQKLPQTNHKVTFSFAKKHTLGPFVRPCPPWQ